MVCFFMLLTGAFRCYLFRSGSWNWLQKAGVAGGVSGGERGESIEVVKRSKGRQKAYDRDRCFPLVLLAGILIEMRWHKKCWGFLSVSLPHERRMRLLVNPLYVWYPFRALQCTERSWERVVTASVCRMDFLWSFTSKWSIDGRNVGGDMCFFLDTSFWSVYCVIHWVDWSRALVRYCLQRRPRLFENARSLVFTCMWSMVALLWLPGAILRLSFWMNCSFRMLV